MKLATRIGIGLVALVLLIALGCFLFLQWQKPSYAGSLQLKGLEAKVDVYFDTYGIPHIYAQSERDAQFALGYVHAQDRLFQMEMIRRVSRGELAEVLGPDLAETDRFFRTIGLLEQAKKGVAAFMQRDDSDPIKQAALAYLEGVNHFVETGPSPLEFHLMGLPKRPFTLEDTYAILGYMGFSFAQAFRTDPLLTRIQQQYGSSYLQSLDVHWHPQAEKIPVWGQARPDSLLHSEAFGISDLFASLPVSPWIGSNSWVLGPGKTHSGQVLFSNDTHMQYSQPSVWYEAHMEAPGLSLYGNYLAGVPFAILGHNRHHAIGLTMLENDDMDFYVEKLNPENPNEVWFQDHWEEMEQREEVVFIKDEEPLRFTVQSSRHGPIMNEALADIARTTDAPVAMWWVYNQFLPRNLELAYRMTHANSMAEVRAAVAEGHAPGLNVMYGDSQGNIAWWAMAKLPRRAAHVNSKLFLDGASGEDEVMGFVDFADNPQSENPPTGFLYSANNQPDSAAGILHPGYYIPEDRARRIVELLSQEKKWDLEGLKTLINDVASPTMQELAGEMVRLLEPEELHSDLEQQALDILRDWSGNNQLDDLGPTIYIKCLYHLTKKTFVDELGEEDFEVLLRTHLIKRTMPLLIQNDSARWWDDIRTESVTESRALIMAEAFHSGILELREQLGPDPQQWLWQKVHQIEHPHALAQVEALRSIFNVGPFPINGNVETINNQMFILNGTGSYTATAGPAKRRIIDFSDLDHSLNVLPTGQSGQWMSPHYDDQAQLFVKGKFRQQMMNESEIKAQGTLLQLQPE